MLGVSVLGEQGPSEGPIVHPVLCISPLGCLLLVPCCSGGGSSAGGGPVGYAPVSNTRDNPPCNTLFVGNLGDAVLEADLQALFGAQQVRPPLQILEVRGAQGSGTLPLQELWITLASSWWH